MKYFVFDSSYAVREFIGYIEAPNEHRAKEMLVWITQFLRVPRHLEFAPQPGEMYNDEILAMIARDYVHRNLRLEDNSIEEGFNWLGDLNEVYENIGGIALE